MTDGTGSRKQPNASSDYVSEIHNWIAHYQAQQQVAPETEAGNTLHIELAAALHGHKFFERSSEEWSDLFWKLA